VEHTVGKLLEGKTPKQAAELKIVDPACGSGSFLLGAFQYLLRWHEDWYLAHDPEKWAGATGAALVPAQDGGWRISTAEKKRILLNNIFGVDIDAQAVEVTKLSLLLKVLEGETGQLSLGFERVLPDLGDNIQCGNSLIGPDYYEGKQLALFSEDELYRINAFDWEAAFPAVFAQGGFDAVIGNPPWISLSGKFGADIYSSNEVNYLIKKFKGNTYMPNIYEYFIGLGLSMLALSGVVGFIVPDRLGFNRQFINLRRRIVKEYTIHRLLYKVPFPKITADTLILIIQRSKCDDTHNIEISEYDKEIIYVNQKGLIDTQEHIFRYYENQEKMLLIQKIEKTSNTKLGSICMTTSGFGGKSKLITRERIDKNQIRTMKGESIDRYKFKYFFYFEFKKKNITGRTTDTYKLGFIPKILIRKTGDSLIATYDDTGVYPEQSLYFVYEKESPLSYFYLLGLLNSKLMSFYYKEKSLTNKKSMAQIKKRDLDKLPIIIPDLSNNNEKQKYECLVSFVDRMLALKKRITNCGTPDEKNRFQRQIDATDAEIDQLVYDLYGLTEEEIRIVEESVG
jgi:type I restriction-modification system DNA methylase subunit